MVTLKITDAALAQKALNTRALMQVGQTVQTSSAAYAKQLVASGGFALVSGDLPADEPAAAPEVSKEVHPKSNKMLTKAKAGKYKSKATPAE